MEHNPAGRTRWRAAVLTGAGIAVAAAVLGICALLLKAQEAYRQAAASWRLVRDGNSAVKQMADELPHAGHIRISPDGMTMSFQLPIQINMRRLGEYISHGIAPPAPAEAPWKPKDVNHDGRIDENDVDTSDARGQIFWGAKEPAGDIWGNFMCYRFQHLDSNGNGVADIEDCVDESAIRMDINDNGSTEDVFLPGELVRFSSTEGDPTRAPELHMTSLNTPLISGRTWVAVKWDRNNNRIAPPDEQDIDGDGQADGPIFREMVWWPSKPLAHPGRTPPNSGPGLWDVWQGSPQSQYGQGSTVCIDLWLLRAAIDRRHFLLHVQKKVKRQSL